MTKIFDALERAQQEQSPAGSKPGTLDQTYYPQLKTLGRLDKILIELYDGIATLVHEAGGNAVEFMGPRARAGSSQLLRRLAQVITDHMGKSVLYINVNQLGGWHGAQMPGASRDGLAKALRQRCSVDEAIEQVGNSRLYTTGLFPYESDDVTALINSADFKNMLDLLRDRFDLVLLDPPPALVSPEALALSNEADVVVLVVESELTRWQVAQVIKEKVEIRGGKIAGVVLNKRRYYIPQFIYKRL